MAIGDYGGEDSDEDDIGKSWQRRTVEIRSEAQRFLSRVGSAGISNWQTVGLPEQSRKLHEAILGYADMIRPKSGKLSGQAAENWESDKCLVKKKCGKSPSVPREPAEAYDLGTTDIYGGMERESLLNRAEQKQLRVTGETLNELWRISNEVRIRGKARHKGRERYQTEKYKYYLPFAACCVMLNQLDECVDSLGWLPGGMKQMEGKITADGDLELYGR